MSRKTRYRKTAAQPDSGAILVIGDRPETGGPKKWFQLISGGSVVDSATFPAAIWRPEIPVARAKEHGFAHVELRASDADRDAIEEYFEAFGIALRNLSLTEPSPIAAPAHRDILKQTWSKTVGGRPVKSKQEMISQFTGRVDSFDDDGFATTVLEDGDGNLTRVRFATKILQEREILPDMRFTYSVYKTLSGGGFTLKRCQPETMSQSEWEDLAKRAREIGDLFEAAEPHAAQG